MIITEQATQKIKSILDKEASKDAFFRVAVNSGGCSGFQYEFTVDYKHDDTDIIIDIAPYQIRIDNMSIAFLKEATLDFVQTLLASEFQITNPQAKSSCGCGISFSV